jgi:oxygen-independent coproporphyrinogen-3 oxidase
MYELIIKYLEENSYIHYEISNFSKEGYESKHNLTYWNNDKYLGIGLGASGYINNYRYTNTRSINKYLEGNYIYEKEKVSTRQNEEYELILGLRKVEGVSKEKFLSKYGKQIEDEFDIIDLVDKKLLEDCNGYIRIPKDKLYIENSILINFIGDNDD